MVGAGISAASGTAASWTQGAGHGPGQRYHGTCSIVHGTGGCGGQDEHSPFDLEPKGAGVLGVLTRLYLHKISHVQCEGKNYTLSRYVSRQSSIYYN